MPYKDPEKNRECRRRYDERNKEKLALKKKEYARKNKEKIKIQKREYARKNREKIKAYKQKQFQENKDYFYNKRREYMVALTNWVEEMKKEKGCRVCNTKERLQYHHIIPETKFMEVSVMVNSMKNREDILEEIKKCEVLCINCHARHHGDLKKKKKFQ